jgi:ribonuclease Z
VLFDCGEGTQISLRALGWGIKAVDMILISHLHGDHVGGLPGLLLSEGNAGRTEPVQVLGPPGLTHAVNSLRVIAPYLPFEVCCRDIEPGERFGIDALQGTCESGDHHVPCLAYRLDLPRGRAFLPRRAEELGIPREQWKRLQGGERVDGVDPEQVLGPPRRGLSLGLVTDTRPTAALRQLVRDVDLLVCEGTYGSDDDLPRAIERKHMTFAEAAAFARDAQARQLVLTHFSPSLADPAAFADNAQSVFSNTIVGRDHLTLSLRFAER